MGVKTELEFFRQEHVELLRFVDQWGHALGLLESPEDVARLQGLTELRELESELLAVRGHCYSEERHLESPYGAYLQRDEVAKLAEDHRELGRQIQDMLVVLRFATIDKTEGIPARGKQLGEFIRRHLALEDKLLTELERNLVVEEEVKILL
ncbi:MAG: hemerythrin domain-containing protein [Candidatus Acidiferrales bacterium]